MHYNRMFSAPLGYIVGHPLGEPQPQCNNRMFSAPIGKIGGDVLVSPWPYTIMECSVLHSALLLEILGGGRHKPRTIIECSVTHSAILLGAPWGATAHSQ